MAEVGDEQLARELQRQLNEQDEQIVKEQVRLDHELAQKLASGSHSISSSSDGENEQAEIGTTEKNIPPDGDSLSPRPGCSEHCTKRAHADADIPTSKRLRKTRADEIPECPYGKKCYRQSNAVHMRQFLHPLPTGGRDHKSCVSARSQIAGKSTIVQRLEAALPVSLFLTKCRDLKSTWREKLAVGISEFFDPALGELESSLHLNFMVDIDWLLEAYAVYGQENKPLTIVHGCDGVSSCKSNITLHKVVMPIAYGVHHSKVMVLRYTDGVRLIFHSANLIEDDWTNRTQSVWVSPFLPVEEKTAPDSKTHFRSDFLNYLSFYRVDCLQLWISLLQRHNFSAVRVFFVGSVPGRHNSDCWGHRRVRTLLSKSESSVDGDMTNWPLVVQCSSIGSLGADANSWLMSELALNMTSSKTSSVANSVYVVYPSEEDVRNSVDGYAGASCLPYRHATHKRQMWLWRHLRRWCSVHRHRSTALPHSKTYCRLSSGDQRVGWLLMTSANLSKAAWGCEQKQGGHLLVRSYEAGVLLLPSEFSCRYFRLNTGPSPQSAHQDSECVSVCLPYSVPLAKYSDQDDPWMCDISHPLPDVHGVKMIL